MLTKDKQSGLSLIELVVTIVILSIALVTITVAINGGLSRSSDTLLELRTATLAKAYMDEILGKRFDEKSASNGVPPCREPDGPGGVPPGRECTLEGAFGADGTETRATFDDVDDYTDIDEGEGGLNPLQDANGDTRTGYDGYRVIVDVRYINVAAMGEEFGLGQNNELDDEYDAKAIKVTVSHTLLRTPFVYLAYKSNF